MGAPAPTLDELDSPRVLHALGALAVDLQDFVADLRKGKRTGKGSRGRGRKKKVGGIVSGEMIGEDGGERK